jgi:short-subunit dehydrogenase
MKFKNKVVIITGASSGIGKAVAIYFAKKQAKVVLAARRMDNLEAITSDSMFKKGLFLNVKTDVTQEDDCKLLIQKTIEQFGRIDILINNAGIAMRALFKNTDLDVIKKIMDVNFWGTVYCTKFALPYLLKSRGSLVGMSSIAGVNGLPARTGYSASKFAMTGFLESLRIETLKEGLHVLVACPGFTASEIRTQSLTADGSKQGTSPRDESKEMTAEQVAEHLGVAIHKRKRDMVLTFNGKLSVLLGKIMPGRLDKMIYNFMSKEENSPFS